MDRADMGISTADGVVTLRGEFDLGNAEELRRCLDQFEDAVTLDMASVTFIDSSAIAAIVTTSNRGVRVTITRPSDRAARVFELCGLQHLVAD